MKTSIICLALLFFTGSAEAIHIQKKTESTKKHMIEININKVEYHHERLPDTSKPLSNEFNA